MVTGGAWFWKSPGSEVVVKLQTDRFTEKATLIRGFSENLWSEGRATVKVQKLSIMGEVKSGVWSWSGSTTSRNWNTGLLQAGEDQIIWQRLRSSHEAELSGAQAGQRDIRDMKHESFINSCAS